MYKKFLYVFSALVVCIVVSGCRAGDVVSDHAETEIADVTLSEMQTETSVLPNDNTISEQIWTEVFIDDGKKYEPIFERIGSPYEGTESES